MSRKRQRGFTLLEVLIAFAIAALALAVMFDASLDGLRATETASRYQEALSLARSHLAGASVGMLDDREQSGDDGRGFHWTLRIRPLGTVPLLRRPENGGAQRPQGQATVYGITATEIWQGGGSERQVRLDSARLGTGTARGG